ncbi:helix-turn-helix domain-containing protein [Haloarculaceae archaeon H-GB2-1]|nr:helix-turn-helix domain-containing protein [Haloarculaceae archaeon H-GB1-1]MEA5408605.1 helix-turn-helix domain-containing protein [Haloarculaceae archaeon H-GB2-1]
MATIAEFTIPTESFPLGNLFENHPDVTLELERVIPTNKAIIPYLWVRNTEEAEGAEIENVLRNHPDVLSLNTVDEVCGEYLIRIEWNPSYEGILKGIAETPVILLSGIGTADEWRFEVRADGREPIATFQQYCGEHDLPMELTALYALSEMETGARYDLTEDQREALQLAYERGYYQSPRKTTLDEMAGELGITGQSLGSRLRRGIHRLLGSTVVSQTET